MLFMLAELMYAGKNMPAYQSWNAEKARAIIARHKHRPGAALPIFHDLQETFGCVPEFALLARGYYGPPQDLETRRLATE